MTPFKEGLASRRQFREVLQAMGNDGGGRGDVRAAHLQNYRQLIDQDITGPLLEQAEAQSDPGLKVRDLIQAHYLSKQFSQAEKVLGYASQVDLEEGLRRKLELDRGSR